MKATDIIIGDWVTSKDLKVPVKVRSIMNHYGTSIYFYHNGSEFIVQDFQIEPIPLTTEILEKNGFVKVHYEYEYPDCQCWTNDVDGDYSFEIVTDEHRKPHILGNREMGDYELVNFECKFVHELQHALKLCGIEKYIEI